MIIIDSIKVEYLGIYVKLINIQYQLIAITRSVMKSIMGVAMATSFDIVEGAVMGVLGVTFVTVPILGIGYVAIKVYEKYGIPR